MPNMMKTASLLFFVLFLFFSLTMTDCLNSIVTEIQSLNTFHLSAPLAFATTLFHA